MAVAAENTELMAYQQLGWTIVEVLLLFGTLSMGVVAILDSRRSAERQLRAYLVVGPPPRDSASYFLQVLMENKRYELYPNISNTGQTPAYEVQHTGTTRALPFPVPDSFDFSTSATPNKISAATLGPGQSLGMINVAEAIYSPEEEAAIESPAGRMRLFTYGVVTYKDAFGKVRRTEFCWYMIPVGREFVWIAHSKHNHAN